MRILRPYQERCVSSVRAQLAEFGSTLVVMATGTGKTLVMAKLASSWERGNVLLLAHRVELLEQARDKMKGELGYVPVIEQAQRGLSFDCLWPDGSVLVGSVQTLRNDNRLEKFRRAPFDLILIDEAHHATAASYRKICDFFLALNPSCKIVGVTATPHRSDRSALGSIFNSCAFEYSIMDAIGDGWLTPIRQEIITIENVDFSHLRLTKNEFGETDFNIEDLQAVLIEEEALHGLARPIINRSDGKQTIIFTAGVPHAHLLAAIINREQPNSAVAVDGATDPEKRKQIIRDFKDRKIQFLANFGIFTEGFDCPSASIVAMGRPTKSRLVYEQMLGRVLRPLNGVVDGYADAADRKMAILNSDKPFALCLDFVGNSMHKLVTVQDVLGGNYDIEAITRAKENAAKKQMGTDVLAELRKGRAELLLEKEQQARRDIKANVEYQVQSSDPFGHGGAPEIAPAENTRGGSSDAQIASLLNLGVKRETAARYSNQQAKAVIRSLKRNRCTNKQQAVLKRHGFDPNVPFEAAREVIDAIAASRWTLRGDQ